MVNLTIEPLQVCKGFLSPGKKVNPHSHEYYQLIYIISGFCDFIINGHPYTLSNNMSAIVRPGEICSWRNTSDSPITICEVKFSVLDEKLGEFISKLPTVMYGSLFTKALFQSIAQEEHQRKGCAEYIYIYLCALLYALNRENVPDIPESKRESPVKLVVQYIEDHYNEELSLGHISSVFNIKRSHLATIFKRATNLTVHEYIYKVRIYKACELIANSNPPLVDVSSMTGFKGVSHFIRVFKKYIGISPGKYRKLLPKERIDYNHTSGIIFNSVCDKKSNTEARLRERS